MHRERGFLVDILPRQVAWVQLPYFNQPPLHLPGCTIHGYSESMVDETIYLLVECTAWPMVNEGEIIPTRHWEAIS